MNIDPRGRPLAKIVGCSFLLLTYCELWLQGGQAIASETPASVDHPSPLPQKSQQPSDSFSTALEELEPSNNPSENWPNHRSEDWLNPASKQASKDSQEQLSLSLIPNTFGIEFTPCLSQEESQRQCWAQRETTAESSLQLPTIETISVAPTLRLTDDIEAIAQSYIGLPSTEAALTQISEEISRQYQSKGFLTSGAFVNEAYAADAPHDLVIGQQESSIIIVREDVVTLDNIAVTDVDGNELSDDVTQFLKSRLGRALSDESPIHFDRLETQLRLLREDPLFDTVEASLTTLSTESSTEGEARPRLSLQATQAAAFSLGWQIDNGSPVSSGGEQATVNLSQRSLLNFGDRFNSSYSLSSTGGLERYTLGYQTPLNALNGTLSLSLESSENKITQAPFNRLGIEGKSRQYGMRYRQPVVRTEREELALSVGFTHTAGQTFLFNDLAQPFSIGPDLDGRSRVSALSFGQSYLKRDEAGAWLLNSELRLGLDWFEATRNQGAVPDGQFVSWLGQVQRSHKVGDHHWLVLQADMQLTPDSLLPSEQFVIGGAGSVRGYRQNLRAGDSGFRLSVEDRIAIARDSAGRPDVFITPFLEAGNVWRSGRNPNLLPSRSFLAGTGIGLLWNNAFSLDDLKLKLSYGVPLSSVPDRGNNLQDSALHFSLSYEI